MNTAQQVQLAANPPIRIGVIGLGLIGGSLAKALTARAHVQVIGFDLDAQAVAQGIADHVLVAGSATKDWTLLQDCTVVFICTPPSTIPELVRAVRPYTTAILTDVASVKKPVLDQITDDRFVGGHPMAGSEKHGYHNANEILFENAVYVLCLPEDSAIKAQEIHLLENLIKAIGSTPMTLNASAHDRAVAAVSHLPHVAAAALALLAARQGDNNVNRLAAGGFRDITRIASSDASLWAGISLESRTELLPLIDQYIAILQEFRGDLGEQSIESMRQYFFQASHFRGSLPLDGRGALLAQSILNVYIPDVPGVIGKITTLLGQSEINITNLRIREFRTYEGGSLQLLLPDSAQAAKAAWLLKEAGYECD
ncbi:MAG: prephenate dehydrogenase/arogenate dehydrogenase family protein [Eubacteriales bacterium]|nr:prephenate dehydrogenase/arogenate dehydrogenase family protein [Eubacteriales bacterium]